MNSPSCLELLGNTHYQSRETAGGPLLAIDGNKNNQDDNNKVISLFNPMLSFGKASGRALNSIFSRRFGMNQLALTSMNKFRFSEDKDLSPSVEDPEEVIQQELESRSKELELRHRELQKAVDNQVQFPVKLYGTQDKYQNKFGYLPDRIMSYYQIHSSTITDYLLKVYKASLYAMADSNQSFMEEYWEEGLKAHVLQALKTCSDQNYNLTVQEDRDFLHSVSQSCEIVDAVLIRGLSMDRTVNKHPKEYKKSVEHEDVGLLTYTPLNLTYNNEDFINPESNKTVYDNYDRMVLRVLVRIRTPLRINISQIKTEDQVCTWEHLCVMENSMVPPVQFKTAYKLETYMEWMGKYRFGLWKMVDIDNCMKGNSPFREQLVQEPLDDVFKGTKLDKGHFINIRDF